MFLNFLCDWMFSAVGDRILRLCSLCCFLIRRLSSGVHQRFLRGLGFRSCDSMICVILVWMKLSFWAVVADGALSRAVVIAVLASEMI